MLQPQQRGTLFTLMDVISELLAEAHSMAKLDVLGKEEFTLL